MSPARGSSAFRNLAEIAAARAETDAEIQQHLEYGLRRWNK